MPANEDYESLSDLADRLGLEDDEKESFIGSAMKRLGYIAKSLWEDAPAGDGNGNGGDFFSTKRREKTREVPSGRSRNPRAKASGSESGWQYND